MKILKGIDYTQARLAGIAHEMLVAKTGQVPPADYVTQYLIGSIVEVDGGHGLVLDETSEHLQYLPTVHVNRLIDYVAEETVE